jgi:hypothetical protein
VSPALRGSGLANFRDLGGLPTTERQLTRRGVLYRSDAPLEGDPAPAASAWPPTLVIDLRSADEPVDPHPLAGWRTRVCRYPLLAEARPRGLADLQTRGELSLDGLYADMVARAATVIRPVIELLADSDGPALVHCAAGKDRTGVLIAMLLRTAGVTRDAIVRDFERTTANMAAVRLRLPPPDREVLSLTAGFTQGNPAPRHGISRALELIDQSCTDGRGWFDRAGVDGTLATRWARRLVGRDRAAC